LNRHSRRFEQRGDGKTIGGAAAGMSAATQVRRMKTIDELEIVVFERSGEHLITDEDMAVSANHFAGVSRTLAFFRSVDPHTHRRANFDAWSGNGRSLTMPNWSTAFDPKRKSASFKSSGWSTQ
jgi:hypothetical protein